METVSVYYCFRFEDDSEEILFQCECGTWEVVEDAMKWSANYSCTYRMNLDTSQLESWDRGLHTDDINLNTQKSEWTFYDDNMNVSYAMTKQVEELGRNGR